MKSLRAATAFGLLLMASCSSFPQAGNAGGSRYLAAFRQGQSTQQIKALPHAQGYWDGDGVPGSPSIVIRRAEQRAYFYKGNQLVGMSPISTGKSSHTTPPGRFKVTEKDVDHRSSLYGIIRDTTTGQIINGDADTRKHKPKRGQVYEGAPMFYFMRFNGAIGMHQGHLPGYPASHGCVRMPEDMARIFYENSALGTPVKVE